LERPIELTKEVITSNNIYGKGKTSIFRCLGETCTKVWTINMGRAKPPSVCPECGSVVRLERL